MIKWRSYFIFTRSTFAQPLLTHPWQWTSQASGTHASLRGLSVVNASVVWASGSQGTVLRTTDGGSTWQLATVSPHGYRSGVAYLPGQAIWVAVGPTGSDYSADGGQTWTPLDTVGYHAIQFAPDGSAGWATGAEGRVVKITLYIISV